MKFNFKTFPTLKTERLLIRQASFNDIKVVFDLRSCEETNKFVATKKVQNFDEAKDFIVICDKLYKEENRIFWLIQYKNKVIGSIVLHRISLKDNYAEIGYKLKPVFHQKGFMSEALKEVLKFAFQKMNLKIIEAFTHKNNIASIALLEKYNFIFQPERTDLGFEHNQIFKLVEN
ncbi:GNAT family N-acetyltransferase [Polaribacter aestuariivivens]|uniref:GNAT family N-acetyltransferase n=1 Tax=Polaribacter aestuariivivens TaxID=2304626 RepID=A0A5S3N5A0_9FLAO|nr:GNAT family N-acetyltransferase [Polaribacter aestuariivivens]TMM28619.1 GNAT family N-acetyltransferase [Polaribacter aestuariivivens]